MIIQEAIKTRLSVELESLKQDYPQSKFLLMVIPDSKLECFVVTNMPPKLVEYGLKEFVIHDTNCEGSA